MCHIEVSDLLAWADVYGCVIHMYVDRRQGDWFRKMTRGQSESPWFLGHTKGRERSSRQAWQEAGLEAGIWGRHAHPWGWEPDVAWLTPGKVIWSVLS